MSVAVRAPAWPTVRRSRGAEPSRTRPEPERRSGRAGNWEILYRPFDATLRDLLGAS